MGTVSVRLTDGRTLHLDDQPVGTGAEKRVFLTRDRQFAVGFYFGSLSDRRERVDRLTRIIATYNPALGGHGEYWTPYFSWPVAMVDGPQSVPVEFARRQQLVWPPLGVVTPVYRNAFYFRDRFGSKQEKEVKWFIGGKASRFVPPEEQGSLLTRMQVSVRLARAIRRMHFAGLAHSDLSNKNVLIDPKGGDACVIDIDSLVVPGIAPPSVLGTPGYIAPEVLAGQAVPSTATDRHALAVLLYQLLLQRHPLQGKRVNSTRSAEEDETLSMGARALFIEHPTDRSNPPPKPISVPYTRLGPHLARLFEKSFVHGLHAPNRRPDAAEWESALYHTLQMLAPTSSGRHWVVAGPGQPNTCAWSGERIGSPLPFARVLRDTGTTVMDEGVTFTLFHHLVLQTWHLHAGISPNEFADRTPQGYVAQHGGKWWLVNTSHAPLRVVDGPMIGHNQSVELVPGLALRGNEDVPGRILQVDFLR